jgi:hypothetical protein
MVQFGIRFILVWGQDWFMVVMPLHMAAWHSESGHVRLVVRSRGASAISCHRMVVSLVRFRGSVSRLSYRHAVVIMLR